MERDPGEIYRELTPEFGVPPAPLRRSCFVASATGYPWRQASSWRVERRGVSLAVDGRTEVIARASTLSRLKAPWRAWLS